MHLKALCTILPMMCLVGVTLCFNDSLTNDVFSSDASIEDSWLSDIDNDEEDFDEETNSTLCSNLLSNDFSNGCQFWMQGILLCVVGFGGVLGNSVSVYVLTRDEMLSVFNQILAVMTFIDTLFLLTSMAEFSFVEAFHLTSTEYDTFFVYFLYPMHNVFLTCSIFLHTVLAFERYLAVCHPQHVYSTARHHKKPAQSRKMVGGHANKGNNAANKAIRKKVLIYVLPVVVVSLVVNIPRWLELELTELDMTEQKSGNFSVMDRDDANNTSLSDRVEVNSTSSHIIYGIAGTWLRYNKYYVNYYLHWTILFVTGILPLGTLAFLNTRIYRRIMEVRKFRTTANSHSGRPEPNYAATLASIIIIFFVCHLPRVIKNIYEIVVTNQVIASGNSCHGITPAKCLVHFNNLILAINASSGFLVYCFVGTFGQQFVKVLTACCKKQQNTEDQELSGQGRRRNFEETDVAGIGLSRSDVNNGRLDNCSVAKQILKVELNNSSLKIAVESEQNCQHRVQPSQETCV